MKRQLLVLTILVPSLLFAQEQVPSKVTSVKLFSTQAEVTRTAHVMLHKGKNRVQLAEVPQGLLPESLRVAGRGSGAVSISGVEYKRVHGVEDVSKEAQALREKLDELNRQQALGQRERERIDSQLQQLKQVSLAEMVPENERVVRPRSSKEMAEVLQFLTDAEVRLNNELKAVEEKQAGLAKQISAVQQQLGELQPGRQTRSVIEVGLSVEKDTEATLDVSYQVQPAGWQAAYNLVVGQDQKGANFAFDSYAIVNQRTGEDWNDVKLTLSTARPELGLSRPEASPRVLDIVAPPMENERVMVGQARRKAAPMELRAPQPAAPEADMVGEPAAVFEEQLATRSEGSVVTYEVPDPVIVKADGSVEKVKVDSKKMEGAVRNIAVPSLNPNIFREAVLRNSTGAPLLPGVLSVFADANYMGKLNLEFTPPEKEMKLPVGIANQVTIKRKLANRFEDDSGVVKSFRRIKLEYEIELENLSSSQQEVIVIEGAPVSRNEKIKAEVVSQEPRSLASDDPTRVQKDAGVMEWHVTLGPKAKQVVKYTSMVEFPADLNVSGLEAL